jgi:rubrerythrin
LELFTGQEAPEKTLAVAYSMEQGLRDFYLLMLQKVSQPEAIKTFTLLAEVELKHQNKIFVHYQKITHRQIDRTDFEKTIVTQASEGGLTTDQYIALFQPQPSTVEEIIAVAISIEAQALDLYQRAAEQSEGESKEFLLQIANEEQAHLHALAELMEQS